MSGVSFNDFHRRIKHSQPREKNLDGRNAENRAVASFAGPSSKRRLKDAFTNRTVMRGTRVNWDAERLRNGKLQKLEAIGGEPVVLTTPRSTLDATYFSTERFLEETGATPHKIQISVDNPLISSATSCGISIDLRGFIISEAMAKIDYDPESDPEGENLAELIDFCQKLELTPFWEETRTDVDNSEYDRRGTILVVSNRLNSTIHNMNWQIAVTERPENKPRLPFLGSDEIEVDAMEFEGGNKEILESLGLDGMLDGQHATNWMSLESHENLYVNRYDEFISSVEGIGKVQDLPFVNVNDQPLELPDRGDGGVVVLSMNQTDSYTQYTPEILTFLMMGMNVLVYDNAKKGLSKGSNSESEMQNALIAAGNFLRIEKGYHSKEILFKGQCSGALPTAAVAPIFKRAHFWIDQAPLNFSDVATEAIVNKFNLSEEMPRRKKVGKAAMKKLAGAAFKATRRLMPQFSVIEDLELNRGFQLYTIGVPNSGVGGDKLVPDAHKVEMATYMNHREKGHYLPMPGAEHVRDWWFYGEAYYPIQQLLNGEGMTLDLFSGAPKGQMQTEGMLV